MLAEPVLDGLWELTVQRFPKNRRRLSFAATLGVLAIAGGLDVPAVRAQDAGLMQIAPVVGEPQEPTFTAAPALAVATAIRPAAKRKSAAKLSNTYFIEFRSRHALTYGHTFVVFGRLNTRGEIGEIKPEMVAGLHPAGESSAPWTVGHVVPVPAETGWSDGDLEEEYVSNRFRVLLTEAEYVRLAAHIKHKKANSPMWHAVLYNCNLWTGEIAQFLGLRTGSHWLPPAEYIGSMREINGGQQHTAATVPPPNQQPAALVSLPSQQPAAPAPIPAEQSASLMLLPFER